MARYVQELERWVPVTADGRPPSVLVPGAGLARLAVEIAWRGYYSQVGHHEPSCQFAPSRWNAPNCLSLCLFLVSQHQKVAERPLRGVPGVATGEAGRATSIRTSCCSAPVTY